MRNQHAGDGLRSRASAAVGDAKGGDATIDTCAVQPAARCAARRVGSAADDYGPRLGLCHALPLRRPDVAVILEDQQLRVRLVYVADEVAHEACDGRFAGRANRRAA